MMIKMLKQAVQQGIQADYVLTDSWFTCLKTAECAIVLTKKIHSKIR